MPPGLSLSYNGTAGWERLDRRGGPGHSGGHEARVEKLLGSIDQGIRRNPAGFAEALNRDGRRSAYSAHYGG